MSGERELDVVLFGATSFVGRLTAEYLAGAAPQPTRIGLAGRSQQRLQELQASLGAPAAQWPLIVADSGDEQSLRALAARTRVLATTVGPYRRFGLGVAGACASAGTHYADLTGEVLFMRETIDRFASIARDSGARIVHSCGFDSIPSDLGVLALHEAAMADGAGELQDTTLVVRAMKGGASGGTIASLKGTIDDARSDRRLARVLLDPYALSPDRAAEPSLGAEGDLRTIANDRDLEMWIGPFIMGTINTRVVRRSNALQDWAYGRRFRYREVMGFGSGPLAAAQA
ncbi:MAG: saccharopine dehydrogenase family protein, partial [Solirubrobacteraceae bacterium]